VLPVPEARDPTKHASRRPAGRKFEHRDTASWPQDPMHLLEGLALVRDVVERDDREDPIERRVGKGDRLPSTFFEPDGRPLPSAQGDLLGVRVEHDDLAAATRHAFRGQPGSPADIEEPQIGRRGDHGPEGREVRSPLADAEPLEEPKGEGRRIAGFRKGPMGLAGFAAGPSLA
jgi:hypothetical protein